MLRPLKDQLLVKLDSVIANNGGFIIAPDVKKWRAKGGAVEGENRGTVHSTGPGKVSSRGVELPMSVKVGDVVRFSELEYPFCKEDGETYVLISEQDVLWVEEEAA